MSYIIWKEGSMMNFEIRILQAEDYLLYKDIRLELLKNHPTYFGSDEQEEKAFDDTTWKNRLSKDTVDSYGVFNDGQLIGLAVVVYQPRRKMKHIANLNSMYVKPSFRHLGAASRLLDAIVRDLSLKKIHRLNLSVVETNASAIQLYQSNGFVEYGLEPDVINEQGKYHSLLLMSLLIGRN